MHDKTRHHPETAIFYNFIAGDLPAGMNLAVSSHIAACSSCQRRAAASQEAQYSERFAELSKDWIVQSASKQSVADKPEVSVIEKKPVRRTAEIFGYKVQLPASLAAIIEQGLTWKKVRKGIHQATLHVDRATRCVLIYMESGAKVPRHTHLGHEAMLMLAGSICDDWDCYRDNDFVLRGQLDSHMQETEEGCVCLFVTDGPLRFTEGYMRLMNPYFALKFKLRNYLS